MSPLKPATPFLHMGETDCVADDAKNRLARFRRPLWLDAQRVALMVWMIRLAKLALPVPYCSTRDHPAVAPSWLSGLFRSLSPRMGKARPQTLNVGGGGSIDEPLSLSETGDVARPRLVKEARGRFCKRHAESARPSATTSGFGPRCSISGRNEQMAKMSLPTCPRGCCPYLKLKAAVDWPRIGR
jgi:hypothetical protein